jgi:hypothetical protein
MTSAKHSQQSFGPGVLTIMFLFSPYNAADFKFLLPHFSKVAPLTEHQQIHVRI